MKQLWDVCFGLFMLLNFIALFFIVIIWIFWTDGSPFPDFLTYVFFGNIFVIGIPLLADTISTKKKNKKKCEVIVDFWSFDKNISPVNIDGKITKEWEAGRAPTFWEAWFDDQETLQNFREKFSNDQKELNQYKTKSLFNRTPVKMALPEDSIMQEWFSSIENILKEFSDKALADPNFNVIYNQEKANRERKQERQKNEEGQRQQETLIRKSIASSQAAEAAAKRSEKAAKRAKRGW